MPQLSRLLVLSSLPLLWSCGPSNTPTPAPVKNTSPPKEQAVESAKKPSNASPWFVRPERDAGIDFTHDSGHRERFFMPEDSSGGCALFDMDGDGDLDAYLVQAGYILDDPALRKTNKLFENDGTGVFTDVTDQRGVGDQGYGMGVVCGDYDNDGDTDLFVTNLGPNILYQNDGTGHFTDVTATAGLGHPGWGSSGAFFDYDRDGDLDLFVCNYLNWSVSTEIDCYNSNGQLDYCTPNNYNSPARDLLYRNNGDGTFSDISEAAGLGASFGNGLGIAVGDFDLDGWLDVFVANDGNQDQLWINQKDATFLNDALLAGCAVDQDGIEKAGMGVTAADIDDDGDLDLMVCNFYTESDSVYRNDGGFFMDITSTAGLGMVSRPFTRFGMAWHDFNNDGLLDLYQANGRVDMQSKVFVENSFAEPNLLFRGIAPGKFTEQLPRGGTAEPLYGTSRAAAFGDLDNDGDMDILVVNRDEPAHLLRNEAAHGNNWLIFSVLNPHGGDALNAMIKAEVGDRTITRTVLAAYSYQASNDPRVHYGLGDVETVSNVTVTWIDGTRENFGDFAVNQIAELRQGEGQRLP